jgi:hypothetical protein
VRVDRDVDSRPIRKSHTRFKHCSAAAHQIRMLVAVQSDAVSPAMRGVFCIHARTLPWRIQVRKKHDVYQRT